jgi:hypothetical protein
MSTRARRIMATWLVLGIALCGVADLKDERREVKP